MLIFFGLLPLVSCLDVEDYEDSWRTAGTDKRLAGNWKEVPANLEQTPENGYNFDNIWHVRESNGAFAVSVSGDAEAPDLLPINPIKTLNAGRYQFLLIGGTNGQIVRYRLNGRSLEICIPYLVEYVRRHYPNAPGIKTDDDDSGTEILRLDRAVLSMFAKVPDREDYWACDFMRFQKVAR